MSKQPKIPDDKWLWEADSVLWHFLNADSEQAKEEIIESVMDGDMMLVERILQLAAWGQSIDRLMISSHAEPTYAIRGDHISP